jgi:hypothetical protein
MKFRLDSDPPVNGRLSTSKAALADPDIEKIHVITRHATPRIEEGVLSGKVQMTLHSDYTDYTALRDQIAEETYALIHVDFPMRFIEEWTDVSTRSVKSFHYISSSKTNRPGNEERELAALDTEGVPGTVYSTVCEKLSPSHEDK